MSLNRIKFVIVFILLAGSVFVVLSQRKAHVNTSRFTPAIPRVWDDAEMAGLQLPLVDSNASPKQISSDYYYRMPVRTIYKNYPVYAPGKEPAGYLEWLKQQQPESALDVSTLKTEADWIRAGELVFDSPISYDNIAQITDVRNPEWHEKLNVPATKDGTLPWFRYVIREKGKVELGTISCAMCHTRVMPDGTVVKGAQGNFPFERAAALKRCAPTMAEIGWPLAIALPQQLMSGLTPSVDHELSRANRKPARTSSTISGTSAASQILRTALANTSDGRC